MTRRLETWPEEWGILFALAVHPKAVYGKVRLNKALALLQMDGFPIKNKFVNAPLGPYDEKIDLQTEELENENLISIKTEETKYENPLYIYKMTKEGRAHFRSRINPYLKQLEELPFHRPLMENFQVTRDHITKLKTTDMVEKVHRELCLDDFNVFLSRIGEVKSGLAEEFEIAENESDDSCPVCLEILGALDFAQRALDAAEETHIDDPHSGKNIILYNAEKLLTKTRVLRSHPHILDPRLGEDDLSMAREEILHRLYCLEYNGEVYDIIHQVKIIEDELGYLVCEF